ncbi:AAA family ATPase, partial [Chloroflexota bacterium]
MIRKIEVDGFKTLSNFVLELKPGLDILVGPNGSGKTNIISFFEFLGLLQAMSGSDTVSSAG